MRILCPSQENGTDRERKTRLCPLVEQSPDHRQRGSNRNEIPRIVMGSRVFASDSVSAVDQSGAGVVWVGGGHERGGDGANRER